MKKILMTAPDGNTRIFDGCASIAKEFGVKWDTAHDWVVGKRAPSKPGLEGCDFHYCDDTADIKYQTDKNGKATNNEYNIRLWLAAHFETFRLNEWTGMLEINGKPIDDLMVDAICINMEHEIGVNNDKKTRQCIAAMCLQDKYNPLKEEIESYEWDGEKRAEDFFIKFLGAHDTPLNRFYTRNWFKAAIKRIYEPGCMWDHMIILYDKTGGTGKSKIFERLSLGYSTQNVDVGNKDAISVMNHAWIINFDELANFDKKGMNALKTFITTRSEVNRLAYARYAQTYNRHCVFCGTTNEEFFLRDYTSDRERRFWVINCSGTRRDGRWWKQNLPDEYIYQLWAEVKSWYDADMNVDTSMSVELQDDERLIQMAHKSFGNDPEFEVLLTQTLNAKFSKCATENFNVLKKEIFATEIDSARVISLDKIPVKTLAAIFRKQESYTAAVILKIGGWIVRDGYAIRTNQYQLGI